MWGLFKRKKSVPKPEAIKDLITICESLNVDPIVKYSGLGMKRYEFNLSDYESFFNKKSQMLYEKCIKIIKEFYYHERIITLLFKYEPSFKSIIGVMEDSKNYNIGRLLCSFKEY